LKIRTAAHVTIAEARALVNAMERLGTVWQCGTQRRSNDSYRFVVDAVRGGRIGQLRTIRTSMGDWGGNGVPLFSYRFEQQPNERSQENWTGGEVLRPLKAIRAKCLDCAPELAHLGKCGMEGCPLYPFRQGKNPTLKGKRGRGGSPESIAHARELKSRRCLPAIVPSEVLPNLQEDDRA
jgi:hypothetical protein